MAVLIVVVRLDDLVSTCICQNLDWKAWACSLETVVPLPAGGVLRQRAMNSGAGRRRSCGADSVGARRVDEIWGVPDW